MKRLPVKIISGLFATTVVTSSICALGVDISKSLKSTDERAVNYIEKDVVSVKNAKVLTEEEKEVKVAQANVASADEAVEDAKTEVKNAQTKVETANKKEETATAKAESTKKEAEKAATNKQAAEEAATKADADLAAANKVKAQAEAALNSAKTTKERKAAEAELKAAKAKAEAAQKAQRDADAAKKAAAEAAQQAEAAAAKAEAERQAAEAKRLAAEEEQRKAQEAEAERIKQAEAARLAAEEAQRKADEAERIRQATNAAQQVENNVKNSNQSNKATTNSQAGGASSQRELSEEDWNVINEALKKEQERLAKEQEGKEPEAQEEHTVEFHFYSTIRDLKVRRTGGSANYWNDGTCGTDGSGCIWFAEFSCDMNECEGFAEPGTGLMKGTVTLGRRGDITEYVMQPPKAKPGYRFKAWEMISVNGKPITDKDGENGILLARYRAVYEKYTFQ